MVHGVPSSSLLYRKFFPLLVQKGYRAVAMDLPGLGLSDKPATRSSNNNITPTMDYYTWPKLSQTLGEILNHPDLDLFGTTHNNSNSNSQNNNNNNNNNNKFISIHTHFTYIHGILFLFLKFSKQTATLIYIFL